jgi:nitroreductase
MQNPVLETIYDRRSIRKYVDKPVPSEVITEILKAGQYAPSARNKRPCHFVVVNERPLLDQLRVRHPYAAMLETAPVCLVVCGEEAAAVPGYWMIDCAAATQNILLAAKALGLGSCWMGVAPREERMAAVTEILRLPEGIKPFAMVAIGYAANEPARPERFDETRIHYNGWTV